MCKKAIEKSIILALDIETVCFRVEGRWDLIFPSPQFLHVPCKVFLLLEEEIVSFPGRN